MYCPKEVGCPKHVVYTVEGTTVFLLYRADYGRLMGSIVGLCRSPLRQVNFKI